MHPVGTLEYVAVSYTASAALRGPPFAALPLYSTKLQSCTGTTAVGHQSWQTWQRTNGKAAQRCSQRSKALACLTVPSGRQCISAFWAFSLHLLHGQRERLWPAVVVGAALPEGRQCCGAPELGHGIGIVQHQVPIGLWDKEC